jgi:hypothetical protein
MPDLAGVDVASYQEKPHDGWWEEAGDFHWAAVKFTELSPGASALSPQAKRAVLEDRSCVSAVADGTVLYVDPDAKADWNRLRQAGKGRIAYLYAHPAVGVDATLDAFHAMCKRLGLDDGDGVMVDYETDDGRDALHCSSWCKELTAKMARAFDRKPIVYTYVDFGMEGYCEGLDGGTHLFVADPNHPSGLPTVPPPWTTWLLDQYDLSGPIDRDVAKAQTLADLRKAIGRTRTEVTEKVFETTGDASLIDLSNILRTEICVILRRTLLAQNDHHWPDELALYLDTGNFSAKLPAGIPLHYLAKEEVKSSG